MANSDRSSSHIRAVARPLSNAIDAAGRVAAQEKKDENNTEMTTVLNE
jgi:hypothetical protein